MTPAEHPATRAELDELRAAVTSIAEVLHRHPDLEDDDRYLMSGHITVLRARQAALRAGDDG